MKKYFIIIMLVSFCLTIAIGNAVAGPLVDAAKKVEEVSADATQRAKDYYQHTSVDQVKKDVGNVVGELKKKAHDLTK